MKKRIGLGLVVLMALTGCGYHTAGVSNRLPATIHVVAVPEFVNKTQTYHIEQTLTKDVIRELLSRTHYRIVNTNDGSADATLQGTVVSTQTAPLTYDPQSGRVSSALVTVGIQVSLTDHSGKVLFENPNYTFREQYQVSREISSFFDEGSPALRRLSRDFSRTLVSDVLEAF